MKKKYYRCLPWNNDTKPIPVVKLSSISSKSQTNSPGHKLVLKDTGLISFAVNLKEIEHNYRSFNLLPFRHCPRNFDADCVEKVKGLQLKVFKLFGTDCIQINDTNYFDEVYNQLELKREQEDVDREYRRCKNEVRRKQIQRSKNVNLLEQVPENRCHLKLHSCSSVSERNSQKSYCGISPTISKRNSIPEVPQATFDEIYNDNKQFIKNQLYQPPSLIPLPIIDDKCSTPISIHIINKSKKSIVEITEYVIKESEESQSTLLPSISKSETHKKCCKTTMKKCCPRKK